MVGAQDGIFQPSHDENRLDRKDITLKSDETLSSDGDLTAGVQKVENISRLWSNIGLAVAWLGMLLIAIAVSFDGQTVSSYQPYALSEFSAHSMLAAIATLQNILNAAIKPVLAKTADVIGRYEAFGISIIAIVIGFIINASSHSLADLAAGQIFYTIGQIGIQFLQQILTADTTTLENRSFFASLLLAPALFTSWIGAPIVAALVPDQWRWGYGMWAIVFPVVSMPLMLSLWWYQRKAKQAIALPRIGASARLSELWRQMDPVGLVLFTASLVLVLLPMTLVNRFLESWSSPATISMIVVGVCCFVAFLAYEIRVARFPILSLQLVGNRTVAAGCLIESFVFLSFYLWQPYYYSFLVVVTDQSAKAATNIVIAQGVATAGTGLLTALVVKWTGNCKWVILAGSAIKLIGAGLMLRYSNSQASVTQILFGQLVSGMGTGMISIVAQTIVQAVARHRDVASVTTLYEASRAVGGAVGNAISGAIWTNLLLSRLQEYLPPSAQPKAQQIQNSFVDAISFPVGSPERIAINRSYKETMHILLIPALVVLAVPVLLVFFLEDVNLFKIDEERTYVHQGNVIGTSRIRGSSLGDGHGNSERDRIANNVARDISNLRDY